MKHRDFDDTIQVCTGLYSRPYYELEAWIETKELKKNDVMKWMQSHGHIPCNVALDRIGVFQTKEEAESCMSELLDTMENYPCCFIREKPLCVLMSPDKYIKEWSYKHSLLEDESLVRNYAEHEYPFWGRPKEMIRFNVGDIVQVVDDRQSFWGVVRETPPIFDGKKHGDWTDDQYTIWLSPNQSCRVPSHHVFHPLSFRIPDYVKDFFSNETN